MTCSVFVRYYEKVAQETQINKKIEVLAKFKGGYLFPIAFKYNERLIKIDSIDLKYKANEGSASFYIFHTRASDTSYKISYNSLDLSWELKEIFLDER